MKLELFELIVQYVCLSLLTLATYVLGHHVVDLKKQVAELSEPRRLTQADHEYMWKRLGKPAEGKADMFATLVNEMEWQTWDSYANSLVLNKVAHACDIDYSEAYRQAWIRTPIGEKNLEMEISRGMLGKIGGYSFGDIDTAPLTEDEKEMQERARKEYEEWIEANWNSTPVESIVGEEEQ